MNVAVKYLKLLMILCNNCGKSEIDGLKDKAAALRGDALYFVRGTKGVAIVLKHLSPCAHAFSMV